MTRKVGKAILGIFGYNSHNMDKVTHGLDLLFNFMQIDDDLKIHRLEWIFGTSEPLVERNYGGTYKMPDQSASRINDDVAKYETTLAANKSEGESMLTKLFEARLHTNAFSLMAL